MDLNALAESDPSIMAKLQDLSISNRALGRELGVDEKNIRRWRSKRLQSPHAVSSPQPKYKNGVAQWVPGMDLGQDEGEVRTVPRVVGDGVDEPEDAELMRELGVDPETWEIIARRESRWQSRTGGEFLKAYRISVRRRSRRNGDLSVEAMNTILRQDYTQSGGGGTFRDEVFVVALGDTQAGKSLEKDGGTPELVDRFGRIIAEIRQRLEDCGGVRRLVLLWLGDHIEGIVSQNGKLVTRQDLSVTEQVRLVRRLMLHQIATLAPLAEEVLVLPVGGNHGRTSNQFATPPGDNWDLEAASAVSDALAMDAERWGHVIFIFPEPEEAVTSVDLGSPGAPFVISATHGDLARSPEKLKTWWAGQAHGRQAAGAARWLFVGHFHHLLLEATGTDKHLLVVPCMDGGSGWFRRSTGNDSSAGVISMFLTPGYEPGFRDIRLHQ